MSSLPSASTQTATVPVLAKGQDPDRPAQDLSVPAGDRRAGGWLRELRAKLIRNNDTNKPIKYCLSRWDAFTRFLHDGRLCTSNNAPEHALRSVAVARRNWTSPALMRERRSAAIYGLIGSARLDHVLSKLGLPMCYRGLPDHPAKRIHEPLPLNWQPQRVAHAP